MKKLIKEINLIKNRMSHMCEGIEGEKVVCDECGWSWDLIDGGDDPYICHKCGNDNQEVNYVGKKVMVYYNLHKHTFSVSYKNKIVMYADYVKLKNVEFRVRQGGKEKVRDEMRKNVHAFVIGTLMDFCTFPCENLPDEPNENVITYNPYKYDSFVRKNSEEPIYDANEVEMINSKNKVFFISEIKE